MSAMRRLFLRRGLTALVGGVAALASGPASSNQVTLPRFGNSVSEPKESGGDERHALADIFYKQRRAVEGEQHLRWMSRHEIDPDLSVLHSTSSTWKAGVMYSRHKARRSVIESINQKIDAIWQEPLAKVQTMVASWIRGAA